MATSEDSKERMDDCTTGYQGTGTKLTSRGQGASRLGEDWQASGDRARGRRRASVRPRPTSRVLAPGPRSGSSRHSDGEYTSRGEKRGRFGVENRDVRERKEIPTHLYSPLAAGHAPRLGPPLDLLRGEAELARGSSTPSRKPRSRHLHT